jgi:dethiobiotin synthetase
METYGKWIFIFLFHFNPKHVLLVEVFSGICTEMQRPLCLDDFNQDWDMPTNLMEIHSVVLVVGKRTQAAQQTDGQS